MVSLFFGEGSSKRRLIFGGKRSGLNDEDQLDGLNPQSVFNRKYQNSAQTQFIQSQFVNSLMFGKRKPKVRGVDSSSDDGLTLNTIHSLKKEDEDGMQHVVDLETLKCRFNEDLRVKEVRTCLQTTRPVQIKLQQGPDVSDHEFLEEEEKFLSLVCLRTMSLPIGRGIFTLHTVDPIPTEPVIIPELNLKVEFSKPFYKPSFVKLDLYRVKV